MGDFRASNTVLPYLQVGGSYRGGATTLIATTVLTAAAHAGKTLLLGEVGGNALLTATLPVATGTGNIYRFVVTVVNTSNYVIKVTGGLETMDGSVNIFRADTVKQEAFEATGADDTLTLDGGTKGGQIGDWVEFADVASNQWAVWGQLVILLTEAPVDPFSATVS